MSRIVLFLQELYLRASSSRMGPVRTGPAADRSLLGGTAKIGRRRSISAIAGRLREKSTVDGRLKKKKGKRRRGKKERRRRGEEVPRASSPAGRPRVVAARERLLSPRGETKRLPAGRETEA
ncbi:hypothetical protein BHM03_00015496, partial [Ensete ventricosum]